MISYRIKAMALDALTLASERQAGNVTHSLDYIPGASVRGAFAAEWDGEKGDGDFLRLFESGQAIFENLRPMVQGKEGFPIPLSTRECKAFGGWQVPGPTKESHGVQDFLMGEMATGCKQGKCAPQAGENGDGTQLVRSPGWYGLQEDANSFFPIRVVRNEAMHNEIADELGTTRAGFLFAIEEIAAETEFVGYVRLLDEDLQSVLTDRLPALKDLVLRVGRDRGRVQINSCEPFDDEPYEGKQKFGDRYPADKPGEFTLTLLSDAILRDPFGRYHRTLSEEYLQSWFGCEHPVTVGPCYSSHHTLSGWRGTHHLFTPKVIVVDKGSAVRLSVGGDCTDLREKLQRLEREGLGDQRAQGFGRVLVNDGWHRAAGARTGEEKERERAMDRPLNEEELVAFVQRYPKELVDGELASRVVRSLEKQLNSGAQLHNLRNIALRDEPAQGLQTLLEHERTKANSKWGKSKDSIAAPVDAVTELLAALRGDALRDRVRDALVTHKWLDAASASDVALSPLVATEALRAVIDCVTREAHSRLRKNRAEGGRTDGAD